MGACASKRSASHGMLQCDANRKDRNSKHIILQAREGSHPEGARASNDTPPPSFVPGSTGDVAKCGGEVSGQRGCCSCSPLCSALCVVAHYSAAAHAGALYAATAAMHNPIACAFTAGQPAPADEPAAARDEPDFGRRSSQRARIARPVRVHHQAARRGRILQVRLHGFHATMHPLVGVRQAPRMADCPPRTAPCDSRACAAGLLAIWAMHGVHCIVMTRHGAGAGEV